MLLIFNLLRRATTVQIENNKSIRSKKTHDIFMGHFHMNTLNILNSKLNDVRSLVEFKVIF